MIKEGRAHHPGYAVWRAIPALIADRIEKSVRGKEIRSAGFRRREIYQDILLRCC